MNNQIIIDELKVKASDLMKDWSSSRNKQKLFILEYMANGFTNATDAAIKAGFSEKSARKQSSLMLSGLDKWKHIPEVVNALKAMFEDKKTELSIASSIEVQQFYTAIMRGEMKDTKLVGIGIGKQAERKVDADLATRIKAAVELSKSASEDKGTVTNIIINNEWSDEEED